MFNFLGHFYKTFIFVLLNYYRQSELNILHDLEHTRTLQINLIYIYFYKLFYFIKYVL